MKRIACLLALLALVATAGAAHAQPPSHLIFSGSLQDERGDVISGIYPLQFSLHRSERARGRAWSERHWVAVEDGVYTVELGHTNRLPQRLDINSAYISVSARDGSELTRVALSERNLPGFKPSARASVDPEDAAPATSHVIAGGRVDYAEKAGIAYEAELARNCQRLENLSLNQVEERIKKGVESGARVGVSTRSTGPAGGTGGRHYRLMCPRGYVAVGIEGGAGIYLDSIEVICAPLE